VQNYKYDNIPNTHFILISVSQALRENTYPYLALIVLRQNRMTVVARIEGPIGEFRVC